MSRGGSWLGLRRLGLRVRRNSCDLLGFMKFMRSWGSGVVFADIKYGMIALIHLWVLELVEGGRNVIYLHLKFLFSKRVLDVSFFLVLEEHHCFVTPLHSELYWAHSHFKVKSAKMRDCYIPPIITVTGRCYYSRKERNFTMTGL